MTVKYSSTSPYYYTPQTSSYLSYWVPPSIGPSITDQQITLTSRYNNRPDLLSFDLYGTNRLYWIFSMVNPDLIKDPINDMVAGLTIYVPTTSSVQSYI